MDITKRSVRSALGFTLDRQLAEFFGVGKAAVSNWEEDELLPDARQWQARALRPDLSGQEPCERHRTTAASAGATAEPTQVVLNQRAG